jgi:hypothetical protein
MTNTRVSNCAVEDVSATALYRACRYSQLSPPALGSPASRTLAVSRTWLIFAVASIICLSLFLGGCRSQPANLGPSIEFSKAPVADVGGPDKLGIIEGRAVGARPGQQIALYALSEGIWWVQPDDGHPFTTIESDSTWKSSTHLGTQYGALLADAGYKPPNQPNRCQLKVALACRLSRRSEVRVLLLRQSPRRFFSSAGTSGWCATDLSTALGLGISLIRRAHGRIQVGRCISASRGNRDSGLVRRSN